MTDNGKVTAHHLSRGAIVYVRQSTAAQVEDHRESTDRQYKLTRRASDLGWLPAQIEVIDQDLGVSGSGTVHREGFARLLSRVAVGEIGIVLGLEASRLARNSRDWYQLVDLCSVTNTLIADADSVYHPGLPNDRLVLGLRGTMSEAELQVMHARLLGGARNKAARGELRRQMPMGYVWRVEEEKPRIDPDEAVAGAIRTVFQSFSEKGSIRQAWLWMRSENLNFPQRVPGTDGMRWVKPTYISIREIMINPVYAGAYAYGKSRAERYVDAQGQVRTRRRKLPRAQWEVFLPDHHEGYIDWDTFQMNQTKIGSNMWQEGDDTGGAAREGAALLQGLGRCGNCGRALRVCYGGRNSMAYYHCNGDQVCAGRGKRCLWVSGRMIHDPIVSAFLTALKPGGVTASLKAAELIIEGHDSSIEQRHLHVERLRYEALAAERRYRAVDPENRLVARGLEKAWEDSLFELQNAETELGQRERSRPRIVGASERDKLSALGKDVQRVWSAVTTTVRDKKELMRALLEEVSVSVPNPGSTAKVTFRWHGGMLTDLDISLAHRRAHNRTDEDTISLIRRLVQYYNDETIAGILNRQKRTTAEGLGFTRDRVRALRANWKIPCYEPPAEPVMGELVGVTAIAEFVGVDRATVFYWLREGVIPGQQVTPGAPWRVRITEELRARFRQAPPADYVSLRQAMRILGVSRQTVWNRIKRGELESTHVNRGQNKTLFVKLDESQTRQSELFESRHADK